MSNKQQIYSWVHALTTSDAATRRSLLESRLHPEVVWRVSHPINTLHGIAAVESGLLEPLHRAFPDLERRDEILLGSQTPTGDMVALHGHFYGSFGQDLFGIPATHSLARLRYGQFFRLEGGMVTAVFVLLDLIDLMRQAGVSPFASSAGAEGLCAPPRTGDGIRLGLEDETSASISRDLVFAMGEGLGSYDQKSLASMGMKRFWSQDMHWYGPSGIGSTRSLQGFEDFHQRPFLKAFPDRSGSFSQVQRFGRIADATYVASGGFPSLGATHLGEYLGTPATGKHIGMRVMDFWRREGSLLAENWVLIDLPDLFLQFGVDLFAHLKGRHVT